MMNRENGKMREELDMEMNAVVWGQDQRNRVYHEIEKGGKWRRRAGFRVAVAVGLCLVMTVSVFAVNGSLFQRVQSWLGGFGEYAVPAAGVSAENQGIKIEMVGAVSDSYQTKLYFSVQDLKGDRLDGNLRPEFRLSLKGANSTTSVTGSECINYDSETKTALIEVNYRGNQPLKQVSGTIEFLELQSGIVEVECPLPENMLTGEVRKTRTEAEGKVLEPEQTPAKIEGAGDLRISSYGFGDDGWLHTQLCLPENAIAEESMYSGFLATPRSKSGNAAAEERYNQELKRITFSDKGKKYMDIAFKGAKPADLSDIAQGDVYGSYIVKEKITGNWKLDFATEITAERQFDKDVMVGQSRLTQITLSDIAITLKTQNQEPQLLWQKELKVCFKDGSSVIGKAIGGSSWSWEEEIGTGIGVDSWTFDKPIDASKVTAIQIGNQKIKL